MMRGAVSHQGVLPNLDALRFVAFLAVMFAHCYHAMLGFNAKNGFHDYYELMQYGVWGVNFFFVLSGFLITRLLLQETERRGRPNVYLFYARRVLRIWPLYAVVLIGAALHYILLSVANTNTHWIYFLLFAGNFHILLHGFPYSPALANLWTIAVEEQFYLAVPLLIWLLRKHVWPVAVLLIIVSLWFRWYVIESKSWDNDHLYFNTLSAMNDLSVGVLLACVTMRFHSKSISVNGLVQILTLATFSGIVIWLQGVEQTSITAALDRFVVSVLFACILFQQVFISNNFFNAASLSGFRFLGKISYGLYMYHAFAIQLVLLIFEKINVAFSGLNGLVAFPLCVLAITVLTAAVSFELVEKKILRLKNRFAV